MDEVDIPFSVHLVGMGALGSILAWHLYHEDIPFTWEDSEERVRAWEASSGLVYPSGDGHDMENYVSWMRWEHKPLWPLSVIETGAFWYLTKSPPNNGTYRRLASVEPLHLGQLPSYHVNVPALVLGTRRLFAAQRRSTQPPSSGVRIIAHGFSPARLHHVVWGWTARAELAIHPDLLAASGDNRPCFYLRTSRFKFGYANPLPGDPTGWIAGSSHIVQKVPHDLVVGNKPQTWREHVEHSTNGLIRVRRISDPIVGWRPVGREDYPERRMAIVRRNEADEPEIVMPAMEGDGIRHAPLLMAQTMKLVHSQMRMRVVAGDR